MQLNQILLRDDVTIITGTERIARELRSRRAMLKYRDGSEVWHDPIFIGPFKRFLIEAWETLFDGRQLLHAEQILTLCKQSIDKSGISGVISTMSLARTMRHAERLVCEYRLPVDRQDHYFGEELKAFYDWHQSFQERLSHSGYVSEYSLPEEITQALDKGRWQAPAVVALVGFIDMTPQQEAFVEVLRAYGTEVIRVDPERNPGSVMQHVGHTQEDELKAAADWFRHQLEVTPPGHPVPRMALVVPGLDTRRRSVAQVLEAELSPNSLLAGVQSESVELNRGFAFAGGERLADLPWVRTAMDLIAVRRADNNLEDLSRLLLGLASPLDTQINYETGNLDLRLRKYHGWKVSGRSFVDLLSGSSNLKLKHLAGVLDSFLNGHDGELLPSEWADLYEDVIHEAGFLNESWLNRGELHQWWAFQEALDIFRSLDAQLGTIGAEPAYRWLDEVCHSRWFSHDHDSAAAIQVLSPDEAAGLSFDRVWIMGLDARSMPGQAAPNPFLPVHRQVQAGVIDACPERKVRHAERTVDLLLQLSKNIVVSYSAVEEGAATLPCGLIDWEIHPALQADTFARDLPHSGVQLVVSKGGDQFPVVGAEEKADLTSGLSILKDFARDNLAAAIIHRLHVKPFPQVQASLSSSLQGQLVHAALARFWVQTRNSDRLHAFTDESLFEFVETCVSDAMEADKDCSAARYGRKLLSLERIRLMDLVMSWLEFEKGRPESFEVLVCEGETTFTIKGMEFPVRIDRIDRVFCEDGIERYLVIDYKTGRIVDMRELNADRLHEPQLPVYSTFTDLSKFGIGTPDGVALGKVYTNELAYHVRSSWTKDLLKSSIGGTKSPTSDTSWNEQLESWRNRLTALAEGFLEGRSQVFYRPHEYLGNHEHLAPLMRLGELQNDSAQ